MKVLSPIFLLFLKTTLKKGQSHLNFSKNNYSRIKINRLKQNILCQSPTFSYKKIKIHRKKMNSKKTAINLKKQLRLGIKYTVFSVLQSKGFNNLISFSSKVNAFFNKKDTLKAVNYYKYKDIYIKNTKLFY